MKGKGLGRAAALGLVAVLGFLVLRAYRLPPDGGPPAAEGPASEGPGATLFGPEEEVPAPSPMPHGAPSIHGIVVDGEGRPVAGAEVAAARNGERTPVRVLTGADGRFDLAAALSGGDHLVGARAPGMAPVLRGGVRPGAADLRIVLHPGARLEGRVLDPAGVPCAGARVRATLRFPGVPKGLGGFEVRSDESGRYSFEGFPAVEGSVEAVFHGSSSGAVEFAVEAGARAVERDLRVETGPALEGVVRGADGSPLEGIVVCAKNREKGWTRSASTDAEGRFALRGLDPVAHDLDAVDPLALWLTPAPRRCRPPERGIEISLERNPAPPAYAVFRVVDPEGRAVRSVRTLSFRAGSPEPEGSASLSAEEGGLLRTGRLRPGRFRIDLRCPEGTSTTGEFTVEAGRTVDLGTLLLAPAASVRGRVLDAEGRPAAKARLFADDGGLPEPGPLAADGTFLLRGLPPGTGRIRVRLAGCAELPVPWRAGTGETADLGDLRLRAATGAFRGSVRSRSGAPVAGAKVRISPWDDFGPGSDVRRLLAGPDGRFEALALAAGRWVLSAGPPGKGEGGDPRESSFTASGKARRLDLAEGEQAEVVLEIE